MQKQEDQYRIIGIDPGTNYLGYGVVEVRGSKLRSVVMGIVDLHRLDDPYLKLKMIFDRVGAVIEEYKPREMACESPFFGENVQSMLKLGRAQGVVMAAALSRGVDVFEYAPTRIKQSVAGSGSASKEQMAAMVKSILGLKGDDTTQRLDATDAMAAALCHHFATGSALNGHFNTGRAKGLGGGRKALSKGGSSSWEAFIKANPEREMGQPRRSVKKPIV